MARHCPEGTLITDAGSTKQAIVDALDEGLPRGCRFLGSHPLAGSEKAGASYATADLFDGRVAILTPTKNTRAEDFDLLEEFWHGLGSVVVQMSPEEHDRALAMTSHLPHVAAAALADDGAGEVFPPERARACSTPRGWPRAIRSFGSRSSCTTARTCWRPWSSMERQTLRRCTPPSATATTPTWNEFLTSAKKNRDALGS